MFVQTIEYEVEVDKNGYYICPQCKLTLHISRINEHKCESPIDWDAGEWSLVDEPPTSAK